MTYFASTAVPLDAPVKQAYTVFMEWKFTATAEISGVDISLCNCECNEKAVLSQRCPIRQYAHGLKLESPFVPSSTVQAKIRQKWPSRWQ